MATGLREYYMSARYQPLSNLSADPRRIEDGPLWAGRWKWSSFRFVRTAKQDCWEMLRKLKALGFGVEERGSTNGPCKRTTRPVPQRVRSTAPLESPFSSMFPIGVKRAASNAK